MRIPDSRRVSTSADLGGVCCSVLPHEATARSCLSSASVRHARTAWMAGVQELGREGFEPSTPGITNPKRPVLQPPSLTQGFQNALVYAAKAHAGHLREATHRDGRRPSRSVQRGNRVWAFGSADTRGPFTPKDLDLSGASCKLRVPASSRGRPTPASRLTETVRAMVPRSCERYQAMHETRTLSSCCRSVLASIRPRVSGRPACSQSAMPPA